MRKEYRTTYGSIGLFTGPVMQCVRAQCDPGPALIGFEVIALFTGGEGAAGA